MFLGKIETKPVTFDAYLLHSLFLLLITPIYLSILSQGTGSHGSSSTDGEWWLPRRSGAGEILLMAVTVIPLLPLGLSSMNVRFYPSTQRAHCWPCLARLRRQWMVS